jgi:hypothetical protein
VNTLSPDDPSSSDAEPTVADSEQPASYDNKNLVMGITHYEASSKVSDGMRDYTLFFWIQTRINTVAFKDVPFNAQVLTQEDETFKVYGDFTRDQNRYDDLPFFLVPGVPVAAATMAYTLADLKLEFSVPYKQHPATLAFPDIPLKLNLPDLSSDPLDFPVPAFNGVTGSFGSSIKSGDFKFTTSPLKFCPFHMESGISTLNGYMAFVDVITSPADPNLQLEFEVFPQFIDSNGQMWSSGGVGNTNDNDCVKAATSILSDDDSTISSSKLFFTPQGEHHNLYVFWNRSDTLVDGRTYALTMILENLPVVIVGKP